MSELTHVRWFDLQLPTTSEFARELQLKHSQGFGLSVWFFHVDTDRCRSQLLSSANAPMANCRLDLFHGRWDLWVGSASFRVSSTEVQRLLEVFAPHGLKIRSAFPSAGLPVHTTSPPTTAPSPAVVHEAAPVTRSRDVECGMSSPPVCTGGDALECDDSCVAALLTAHESL